MKLIFNDLRHKKAAPNLIEAAFFMQKKRKLQPFAFLQIRLFVI
jgi:hypothetical protein